MEASVTLTIIPSDVKASDEARVNDLAEQYGLAFKRVGKSYVFDDFNAWNLDQALGYVEGYDRAMLPAMEKADGSRSCPERQHLTGFLQKLPRNLRNQPRA
jgi:hypothetical protein